MEGRDEERKRRRKKEGRREEEEKKKKKPSMELENFDFFLSMMQNGCMTLPDLFISVIVSSWVWNVIYGVALLPFSYIIL